MLEFALLKVVSESTRIVPRRHFGLISRNWERKRFYKCAKAYRTEEGSYGVKLDHRVLRTPLRKVFQVPSELLAAAVAQEWNAQEQYIQPPLMHLTALCNNVIDDPTKKKKDTLVEELLGSIHFDTLCYLTPEPESLLLLQRREWSPVVDWFNERFNTSLRPSSALLPSSSPTPSSSLTDLKVYINGLNDWALSGFVHSVHSCKSVVLTCAMFQCLISPKSAAYLAALEMHHQSSLWGVVDWQHTVESEDLRSRLAACFVLANEGTTELNSSANS